MKDKNEINCKNCIRFKTCKFVEKNEEFTKEMYPMFKYAEWNNLKQLFYNNANTCQYFIHDKVDTDELLKIITSSKFQLDYIRNYLDGDKGRLDSDFIVNNLKDTLDSYIKDLQNKISKVGE